MVTELLMSFLDVAFLPSWASFPPHFLKMEVEVKASGQPYVIKLWLGVSKGMLSVKYFCSNTASFLCQTNFIEM